MSNYQQITNTHLASHSTKLDDIVTNTAGFSTSGLALENDKATATKQDSQLAHLSNMDKTTYLENDTPGITSRGMGAMAVNPSGKTVFLQANASGDLHVELSDYTKGQELMADSLPVVISSDQSSVPVEDSNVALGLLQDNSTYSASNKALVVCGVNQSGKTHYLPVDSGKVECADSQVASNTDRSKSSGSISFGSSSWVYGTFTNSIDMADHSDIGFSLMPSSGHDTYGDIVEIHVSSDDVNYFPVGEVYGRDFNSTTGCWNSSFENKWRYVKFYLHSGSSGTWTISALNYSLSNQ